MEGQFGSGVELMLIGMGIVFLFLGLLVVAINGLAWIIARWFPANPAPAADSPGRTAISAPGHEEEIIAAISAAVHRYRTEHRARSKSNP